MRPVISTDIYAPILIMIRAGNTTNLTSWLYISRSYCHSQGIIVTTERVKGSPELKDSTAQLWYSQECIQNNNSHIEYSAFLHPKVCFLPAQSFFVIYRRLNVLLRFRLSKNRQVGGNIHLATQQEICESQGLLKRETPGLGSKDTVLSRGN